MPGKYTPLENYLRGIPANQKEVKLSFVQIEWILNGSVTHLTEPPDGGLRPPRAVKLPSSAYESELWWTKEKEANHVTPRSWSSAGWRVDGLNLNARWVRLVRVVVARSAHV